MIDCACLLRCRQEFKVDTFEYRLVRDTEFREAKLKARPGEQQVQMSTSTVAGMPVGPPQIVQRPRSSKLLEGSDAVFQAKIAGNPKPRISWFKNGIRIQPSSSHQVTYENQIATLNIQTAQPSDTGHYTLLAENPSGEL